MSKRSQRRNAWGAPRNSIVGVISPRAWRRVFVRDKAYLDDAGGPCSSQGVAKHSVNHRGEHQGLGVSTESPSSNDDTRTFCKLP